MLHTHGYAGITRSGSQVQPRDVTDDGTVRNVTVPMYDRIDVSLLHSIADQCGAQDFHA